MAVIFTNESIPSENDVAKYSCIFAPNTFGSFLPVPFQLDGIEAAPVLPDDRLSQVCDVPRGGKAVEQADHLKQSLVKKKCNDGLE